MLWLLFHNYKLLPEFRKKINQIYILSKFNKNILFYWILNIQMNYWIYNIPWLLNLDYWICCRLDGFWWREFCMQFFSQCLTSSTDMTEVYRAFYNSYDWSTIQIPWYDQNSWDFQFSITFNMIIIQMLSLKRCENTDYCAAKRDTWWYMSVTTAAQWVYSRIYVYSTCFVFFSDMYKWLEKESWSLITSWFRRL